MMLNHCLIISILYLKLVLGLGFPVCPDNGVLNCLNDSDMTVSTFPGITIISNCYYIGCPSLIIDSSMVAINNVTFRDSVGPSISVIGSSNVNISDVHFYNSSVSLEGISSNLNVINCLFKSARLQVTGSSHNINIESSEFMDNQTPSFGGAILINSPDSTVSLLLTNSLLARNKAGLYGGALHLYGLRSAYISNSTFTENSAMDVGVLVASSKYLQISGCQFIRNSAISIIGAIRIEYAGSTLIENTFFIENTASLFGAISFAYMHSEAYVRNCHFVGNSADDGAGSIAAIYISQYLLVDSCTFVNNSSPYGYGGSIALVNVESCSITNSSFNSESAYEGGGSIVSSLSDLFITNCTFVNCSSNLCGGVLHLVQSSTATITDTIFRNTFAYQGGVIFALNAGVNIKNCSQSDSKASDGALIYLDNSTFIIQKSNFVNNVALFQGGAILTYNSMVSISDSYFFNGNAEIGGHTYSVDSEISISNSTFDLNSAYVGGFTQFYNTKDNGFLSIASCVISNSFARDFGGALHLICQESSNILIQDCLFHNSSAVSKFGLLLLQSTTGPVIFRNCEFVNTFSSSHAIGGLTASTYFTNCLFSNSVSLDGGGNLDIVSTVYLVNCTITGAKSLNGGFATVGETGSSLIVSNSKFSDIIASDKGGVIYSDQGTVVSFTGCSFESINAYYQGVIAFSHGYIEVFDCAIKAPGNSETDFSLFYVSDKNALLMIDGLRIDGKIPDIDGSIVFCRFRGTVQINNLSISKSQSILFSVFAIDILASITISDSVFIDIKGESLIKASSFSTITIINCTIAYSDEESSTTMDQVFSLEIGSSLSLISSKISNFQGAVAVILAPGGNTINCVDSTISGAKVPGSSLMLYNGEMISSNCSFVENVSTGSVNECISRNSGKSFIAVGSAIFGYSNTITLTGGTAFRGNGADLGGAIYCVNCELIFNDIIFQGNTASLTGGAVWSDSSNVKIGDCQVSGNKALSLPASNDFFLSAGQLTRSNIDSINISIYVGDDILSNFILFNSSMISLTGLRGSARSLNVLEYSDAINASSTSDYLPSITVVALDVFNEVVSIDPNDPIIIQVSLEGSNKSSSLSGESSKLMATKSIIFSDLQIIGKVPGATYKLTISSINRPEISPKSIAVLFLECDSETQVLFKGTTCVPLLVGNGLGAKVTVLSIYALQAPLVVASLIFLYKYRNFELIQANSFIFLFISGIGCLLAISALPFTLFEIGCYPSIFLEKIGFSIVFSALILKVYRVNLIFYSSNRLLVLSEAWKRRLQDQNLAMILASLVVCTVIYLAVWIITNAPKVTLNYSTELRAMIKNTCDMNSPFAIILEVFQFSAVLILSYFAYLTRGIPAKFNEAKVIGFACYNWLIFGSFFYLTAEYLINEPELKLTLKAVSLYLSYGIISFSLIAVKVYKCKKFLDNEVIGSEDKSSSINVSWHQSIFTEYLTSKKSSSKVQ